MGGLRRVESSSGAEISTQPKSQEPVHDRSVSSPVLRDRDELRLHLATTVACPSLPRPIRRRSISPVSFQSRNDSGYLTPPLEGFHDTAPYTPTQDDRTSLNMHNARKRKRKTNHWHSSGCEHISEPVISSSKEIRDVQIECLPRKDSDGKDNEVSSHMILDPSLELPREYRMSYPHSSNLSASPPHMEHWSWQIKHDMTNVFPGGSPELAQQITSDRPKRIRDDLTRISQALAARKHPKCKILEPRALPVQTYSTAVAFRAYKPKSELGNSNGQTSASHHCSKPAGSSAHPKQVLPVGYRVHQRSSVKSRRLHLMGVETPAMITLRRASGIAAFTEATTAPEASLRQIESVQDMGKLECRNLAASYSARDQATTKGKCGPVSEPSFKDTLTTIMQHPPSNSDTAETAITYANVHVVSPIVARTSSGEGLETSVSRLLRTSAVQSRAKGSVHEIIWKDDHSSSSLSSAGKTSPRLSLQLSRTESDPSNGSCRYSPSVGLRCDSESRFSYTRSSSWPKLTFVEDVSHVETQSRIVGPPHVSQTLSEWTWNYGSVPDSTNDGAMSCFEFRRTGSGVQDEGKHTIVPLLEVQGFAPGGVAVEPHADLVPVSWEMASLFNLRDSLQQSSNNVEVRGTSSDQSTGALISPTLIKRTPTETAQRSPLSVRPESERSEGERNPRQQESCAQYVTIGPPCFGHSSVAGSVIGASSRVRRRSTRLYPRSSSRRLSGVSLRGTGGFHGGPNMQRRTTDSTSRVVSASWLAGLQLFRNSAPLQKVLSGDTDSSDRPGLMEPLILDSTGPNGTGFPCPACTAELPNCSRNPSVDWIG